MPQKPWPCPSGCPAGHVESQENTLVARLTTPNFLSSAFGLKFILTFQKAGALSAKMAGLVKTTWGFPVVYQILAGFFTLRVLASSSSSLRPKAPGQLKPCQSKRRAQRIISPLPSLPASFLKIRATISLLKPRKNPATVLNQSPPRRISPISHQTI